MLEKTLKSLWTARRSNKSILKEISPEYSLEGLMLKLRLQYFGHLMGRTDSLEKTLMLRKIDSKRRRGQQRMRWLDSITNSMDNEFEQTLGDFGEGSGTPLQYSCLANPMDGGAWWAAVHGVATSRKRLSNFTFTFHFHALEKEMVTHSSVLAWRIPGMGEPCRRPSMGSHRVAHN